MPAVCAITSGVVIVRSEPAPYSPRSSAVPYSGAMSDRDVYVSPSRVPAGIALLLAVLGTAGMFAGFALGVPAALDAGGSGAGGYVVLFLAGAVLVLAALVIAIVCLVRGLARGIAILALVVALVPVVGVVILRISAIS